MIKDSSPFLRSRESFFRNTNKMKFDSKIESKRDSIPISSEKHSESRLKEQETLNANSTIMEEEEYNFNNYKLLNTQFRNVSP
jgi:hypothetical protein